jgi:hypothetical protein
MKSILRRNQILTLILSFFLLNGCGGSDAANYWNGEVSSEEDKLAKKACDCLNTVYSEKGINVATIVAASDVTSADEAEMKKKQEAAAAEMAKASVLNFEITDCGKALIAEMDKLVTEKKVNAEKYRNSMLSKCRLTPQ